MKGGDQHNFNLVTETRDAQKGLVGPVYLCEKGQINVATPRAEAAKEKCGPVYLTEEAQACRACQESGRYGSRVGLSARERPQDNKQLACLLGAHKGIMK